MFALLYAEHNVQVEERGGIMKGKERLEGEGEEWANGAQEEQLWHIAKRTIYSSETEDKKVNMGHEACRYLGRDKAVDAYSGVLT